eukprot:3770179-Rhodomonas_salina.2
MYSSALQADPGQAPPCCPLSGTGLVCCAMSGTGLACAVRMPSTAIAYGAARPTRVLCDARY